MMHRLGGKRLISLSCKKPACMPTPRPGRQRHTFRKSQVGRRLVWVLWGALSALVPPSIGVQSPSAPHAPAVLHLQSGHSQALRALSFLQGQRPRLSWNFAPHLCPGPPLTWRTRVLSLPLFLCPTHPSLVTSFQDRRVRCASRLASKAWLPQLRNQERSVMVAGSLPSQACASVLGTECPASPPPSPQAPSLPKPRLLAAVSPGVPTHALKGFRPFLFPAATSLASKGRCLPSACMASLCWSPVPVTGHPVGSKALLSPREAEVSGQGRVLPTMCSLGPSDGQGGDPAIKQDVRAPSGPLPASGDLPAWPGVRALGSCEETGVGCVGQPSQEKSRGSVLGLPTQPWKFGVSFLKEGGNFLCCLLRSGADPTSISPSGKHLGCHMTSHSLLLRVN